ncbi:MAG: DUF6389 family protein [Leucobacter sp.]
MNQSDYESALRPLLEAHSDSVRGRLERFAAAAGTGVDAIVVNVFVDQDGEGPFDVVARFEGREGFALDRRFDGERELFGVTWGELGWEPDVPARPAGWSRDDLEDAAIACIASWLRPLLPEVLNETVWRLEPPDGLVVGNLG